MPRPDAPRYGAGCIPPPPTAGRRWFATTLRHHTGLARLPTRLQILRGVAAAVKHLHDHCAVLHNDLRADNVLLDVRKGQLVVKVSDFGLAEELQAGADTRIVKPTNALWIAPEVHWGRAEGPYPVNTSTDVFALGECRPLPATACRRCHQSSYRFRCHCALSVRENLPRPGTVVTAVESTLHCSSPLKAPLHMPLFDMQHS